jgi:hypothetical protein
MKKSYNEPNLVSKDGEEALLAYHRLLLGEKFWHPSCTHLYEAKILVKYGEDDAYGGASHLEKRCLIFTRWSTAIGGKATRLFVLMIFLALKGRPSKVFFFFNKVHFV